MKVRTRVLDDVLSVSVSLKDILSVWCTTQNWSGVSRKELVVGSRTRVMGQYFIG